MDILNQIVSSLLPTLIVILIPTVGVLATWLALKLGKNMDSKNKIILNSLIMDISSQAIMYAEQLANNYEKENKEKVPGSDKLQIALDYAIRELEEHKITTVTAETLARKIESILGLANASVVADGDGSAIEGFKPGDSPATDVEGDQE